MSATIETGEIKQKAKTIFCVNKVERTISEIPFLGFTASGRVKLPRRTAAVRVSTVMYFYSEYEEEAKEHLKKHIETDERRKAQKLSQPKASWRNYYIWREVRRDFETVRGRIVNGRLQTKGGINYRLGNLDALVTSDKAGVKMLRQMAINPHKFEPKKPKQPTRAYNRTKPRNNEFKN